MKGWREKIKYGIGFIELKHTKKNKIHPHIHILAECVWLDEPVLSEMWRKATAGEGYIVKIKRVSDLRGGVYEVTKYVSKISKFKEDIKPIIEEAIKKISLVVKYNVNNISILDYNIEKISDEEALKKCPICGNERDWLRDERGRIKIFRDEPSMEDIKEYLKWDFW